MNKFIEKTSASIELAGGRGASVELKTMMQNSVLPPKNASFMADSLKDARIASKVEYCKDGAGPDPPGLISEVDRCTKFPSGNKYAAVILQINVPDFNKAAVGIENIF